MTEQPPASATVQNYDILFNVIGLLLVGFVGFFGNIFILFVMRKYKSLQTPCFLLIAGECLCSIFISAGFFLNGAEEAAQMAGILSENRTRIYCYLSKSFMPVWGIQGSSLVTAFISLDRLMSILNPMKYRHFGKRYAYTCLIVCFAYTTAATVGGLLHDKPAGFGPLDTIPCQIFFSAFTPGFFDYYGTFNLSFCVPCVFLYGIMLITFEWRRRRMNTTTAPIANEKVTFMKQQMACMPMIRLMMAVYVITAVVPEITVAIAAASETCKPYMPRMYYYGSVVKASTSLAEILALGLGSRQFRQCVKEIMGKNQANTVGVQKSEAKSTLRSAKISRTIKIVGVDEAGE